ncbi:DUF2184 domain-containing protein [Bordetella avium]|uniref:DUF2184 domain-containing protein n=1 Tax=Bordetella avium TaxID=521 RepID=UPI000E0A4E4D|nr:DUF2184 domain-containing protein [Bordetella avium]UOK17549.1 hypothetical protein vBBaMIFTN9_08 [Bordetella phage vB_BaM-IFTN9]RIQ11472.1 DUF2184 domain-containing protein [Bordetella avium]RIQ17459.1 DUF2184 domain-containing protein [Bordetella avium]RIQ42370.1 DUF2184 domain-containing protein [Bordetella avium]RIQ42820.1 DUF2184 domain-containing protein [Bordetella avium]
MKKSNIIRAYTRDGLMTFDQRTIDSAGAFLVGELERLDQNLHAPLAAVTWSRDIDLREDVSVADEFSSFTNSSFAAASGTGLSGKAWIGKEANAITGIGLDIGKTAQALSLWGMQLGWTLPELESAQKLGRPVDQQKYAGMQLKYNMDIDEQVYIGDVGLGQTGLVNGAAVTNVANATTGNWATATAAQILADVNELLSSVWAASAYAVMPSRLLIDPTNYGRLVSTIVSSAGNISILEFLKVNSLSNAVNGRPLDIQPLKWLVGRGTSNTNRMVAYTKEMDRVRFPLVPLQRTPLEYRDLRQLTTYFGRLGAVEFVYPETVGYRDGI